MMARARRQGGPRAWIGRVVPRALAVTLFGSQLYAGSVPAATIHANPETYVRLVRALRPGDVLQLDRGRYEHGLRIRDLHGAPGRPILIYGPRDGPPAVFEAREDRDTVTILNASYLVIRHLVFDGRGLEVDAVRTDRRSTVLHHITLENLTIVRHGPQQQTVGIATSAPASFWSIRGNVIIGAGTGLYLGNPDGTAPFVAGLIEGNVIVATTGYNAQIKHQARRPLMPQLPVEASRTIIRGNVFAKSGTSSTGPMARPNLLLGHFPLDGPGSEDEYRVEQNVFYGNPTETLLQAEGNLSITANLFLNPAGDGVSIQPHNDVPRRVDLRGNFIAAKGFGLRVVGAHPRYTQVVERTEVRSSTLWPGDGHGHASGEADEGAVAALGRWLGAEPAARQPGERSALFQALEMACNPVDLKRAGLPPVSVMPAGDPACAALARMRNLGAGTR